MFGKLLRIIIIIADLLVFYPIDEGQTLGPVDDFAGDLDESLRIALEIRQPTAFRENPDETLAGELGPILEIRQYIGKRDVAFLDGYDSSTILASFRGLDAALPDREIGLSDPDTRLRYRWPVRNRLGAVWKSSRSLSK